MINQIFTEKQIVELKANLYVMKVGEKSTAYTDEFKVYAISDVVFGKTSTKILEEAGFNLSYIKNRTRKSLCRWQLSYK